MKVPCMQGSSTPRGPLATRDSVTSGVAFHLTQQRRHPDRRLFRGSIACLHVPPTNASTKSLRTPPHGAGPPWLAKPSVWSSFISSFMPVYPGASVSLTDRAQRHPLGEFFAPAVELLHLNVGHDGPDPDGRVVARVHVAAAGDQERVEGASGDQPAGRERPGARSGRAGVGVLMGGTRARGVGATWGCDVDVIRGTAYRLAATRLAGLPRRRELSRARQG